MQQTILKSLFITAIITFTLTSLHHNEKIYDEYFIYNWLESWCVALTITLVFNILIFPYWKAIRKNKKTH
ncbi:DUF2798 domain-containing protein [Chryseobacterium viscerum]|uniref:DUF2798 domain-containing protein n=1 Tax=Chryseobacterium viscerum TaxID=1037377 RepID=A0A316WKG9_9FLAO|nr:DUF2798 domain-containing protein [Chryseobacterium viscerum]PWN61895.1 DUF2798 domain-containing protein [Chryseobacterium viscerum]